MALTAEQQQLLNAIHRVLAGDAEIEAAWLGGSLGRDGEQTGMAWPSAFEAATKRHLQGRLGLSIG